MKEPRKANWFDKALRRVGNLGAYDWFTILFWVVVIGLFIMDPLDLYGSDKWMYLGFSIVISLVLLIVLSAGLIVPIYLGKLVFVIETQFELYRRGELRQLFANNRKQLAVGVPMRGKWKELYEFLSGHVSPSSIKRFDDVEVVYGDGDVIEFPITKWKWRGANDDGSPIDLADYEPIDVERLLGRDWDVIETPTAANLFWKGLAVIWAFVVLGGAFFSLVSQVSK